MLPMARVVRPRSAALLRWEFGPPLERPLADPFSETKNPSMCLICFPRLPKPNYGTASRLTELPTTSRTWVFDKPSPKRRCLLINDSRFICAVCFVSASKGGVLRATVYRNDQRLSRGQVHVTCWNQYDDRFLHA